MANDGLGAVIKLGGSSEFKDALSSITQQLRETGSELRAISADFAASDKSEQAVINTTDRYSSVLSSQKSLYNSLQSQYERMGAVYAKNENEIKKLNAKKDEEYEKLEKIGKELGTSSKEYQDQVNVVADLEREIDKANKTQSQNEKEMSRVRTQMNNTEASISKTSLEMKNLGEETEDTGEKAKKASKDGFTVFKGVLSDLYSKAISAAIDAVKNLGSAIVDLGKQAVSSAANYEQIIGGVETLFGDSASTVEQYANNAYKTAGLSANQYMETVTGFSASLLQSLGGDTQKAADIGDMAVSDMADNANKFGTSMDSIQNAYQGFAKQNYTMLDNLKLGYGGTKSEMERLLVDAEKISGIHYDISSLSDVYNAIHVVQQEMGVTGTTAQEAAKTISGSANATKSAWQNVLTAIGTGADLTPLINNLLDSLGNLVNNLSPVVKNVVKGLGTLAAGLLTTVVPNLIQTIPPLIAESVPLLTAALQNALDAVLAVLPSVIDALSGLIPQIVGMLISMLPKLIEVGMKMLVSLVDGITRALPQLISMLPKIIIDLVNTLLKGGPQLAKAGLDLILALAVGIVDAIPQLVDMLPQIIEAFVNGIITNLINVIETGIKIIFALINGLIKAIPSLVMAMPKIIIAIVDALIKALPQIIVSGVQIVVALIQGLFSMYGSLWQTAWDLGMKILQALWEFPGKVLEVGGNIVRGLWEGMASSFDWIKNKIAQWVGDVFNFIKQLFGIASPSKLFRDEIGANLALGIGEGFSDEMKNVEQEMKNALPTSFDVDTNLNNRNNSLNGSDINSITYFDAVNAFKDALSDMTIELDNENMGRFVRKTVTKAIYA